MTLTTPITTSESTQRTTYEGKTPTMSATTRTQRGVRALAAVAGGLFGGRAVAPVAQMQRVAQHLQQTSRVGRQLAA